MHERFLNIKPKNDFLDMNFGLAHKKGFNGENITIGIIDSYLDVQHPDIKNSFVILFFGSLNEHELSLKNLSSVIFEFF